MCRSVPAFEHALLVRICQLLITQLQNLLDPACDPAVQATDLRITLRVVRTVLSKFYRQLRAKCGVFIETLLAGTVDGVPPASRIHGYAHLLLFVEEGLDHAGPSSASMHASCD